MISRSAVIVLVLVGMVVVACSSGETELSTTSSLLTGTTEPPIAGVTTTSGPGGDVATSTTLVGTDVDAYEVVARIPTDNGEILHIVIPPGAYTDVDLENFIGDLREAVPELWGLEIFDDPEAAAAFVVEEERRTDEEQQLLDDHHFASLVDGDTLAFRGPFSDLGEHIIGS